MPRMGDLAATDVYSAFDVPLDQGTNVGWANRLGEILTTRPQYDETVQYATASPLVQITEGDIGRATEAALGGMTVTPKGIKAYHSSPHDFEKFDLAKIGTGEGAQVYGHGLYFAENPAVSGQGGQYWQQFAPRFKGAENTAMTELRLSKFDRDLAARNMAEEIKKLVDKGDKPGVIANRIEALRLLESGQPVGPRTYEVNINADPAHLLDWDKPLTQQSGVTREALWNAGLRQMAPSAKAADAYQVWTDKLPVAVGDAGRQAHVSNTLREAGIPGIKYLDEGSRHAPGQISINTKILNDPNASDKLKLMAQRDLEMWQSKPLTSNYVIFDPNILRIDKKYVVPGAAAGMGALAAQDEYRQ